MPIGNEVIRQSFNRLFLQPGGPSPNNRLVFAGREGTYATLTGVKRERLGGIDPINFADPIRRGQYRQIGASVKAPGFDAYTLTLMEKIGGLPMSGESWACGLNAYESVGMCKDPSDYDRGWSEYIRIYPAGEVISFDDGDRVVDTDDKPVMTKLAVTLKRRVYNVGALAFGKQSVTATGTEIVDICYGSTLACGDCQPANDGTQWIYAVAKGAVAAAPNIFYSTNKGATWTNTPISVAANAEVPAAIDIVGSYLVVLSKVGGGTNQSCLYYAYINPLTGVPGSFTKVTTGFPSTAGTGSNDMIVVNNTLYLCGDGGYILRSYDVTQGVTVLSAGAATTANLNRLDALADGTAIYAVGATGTVIKSLNQGATWQTTTTSPVNATLTGVAAITALGVWVVSTNGNAYYTPDGGESWQTKFTGTSLVAGGGSFTDIIAATPEVIYFGFKDTTPTAYILGTTNAGVTITNTAPRYQGLSNFNGIDRLNIPKVAYPQSLANNLAVAGLAAGGTDGVIYLGIGNVL